tara:strand:- start:1033 stop:1998 length:966 start_codon:yes stop_codon:yes gene_type:complete
MIAEERVENLTVDKEGDRIDVYIANHLNLSRTRVQNLVEDGCVLLNGLEARKSERLEVGQEIEVRLPVPVPLKLEPEDIELDIYFEDSSIIVVNKLAGMVVHPGPGHYKGTLVNALLAHASDLSGIGGILRPGIVHRLDKDTSGLMVVAKTDDAHQALSRDLQRREIKRCYQTASWGHLAESPLEVNAPVGRDPSRRQCMKVIKSGRHAVTHFRVIEDWAGAELLEVALETGRTHQIRVHLAHIGHPVVGDSVYGLGWERGMNGRVRIWAKLLNDRISRQFLHAWHLSFRHPISKEVLTFQSPLPEDLRSCAEWARSGEGL